MPTLNGILSLTEHAENTTYRWFIKCINDCESPLKRDRQRKYICSILNSNIRQAMLDKILSIHLYSLDMTTKCHFIALLADHSTRTIDLSKGGDVFIDEVFHLYHTLTVSSLSSLQSLKIKCDIKGRRDEKYILEVNSIFYKSLQEMTKLRYLTLTGIGETALLEVVGQNCLYLEHIDVRNSNKVDDESISSLLLKDAFDISDASLWNIASYSGPARSFCHNLKFLGLSNTEVTSRGVLLAVKVLPLLTSFGGFINQGTLSKALSTLGEVADLRCLALTHLWEFNIQPTFSNLIQNVCPNLKFLSIGGHCLSSISNFNSLHELVIECDFHQYSDEILDVLDSCGKDLRILKLNESINCSLDLAYLPECAPHLSELEAPLKMTDGYDLPSWENLRKAKIWISSSACLSSFLHSCTSIEHLTIHFAAVPYEETAQSIDDELLRDVLLKGGLSKLRYLCVEECALSELTLQALLLQCPFISHIEKVSSWRNLESNYILKLKERIIKLNWNLKIV